MSTSGLILITKRNGNVYIKGVGPYGIEEVDV